MWGCGGSLGGPGPPPYPPGEVKAGGEAGAKPTDSAMRVL